MAKYKYNAHLGDALKAQSEFLRGDIASGIFASGGVKGIVDKAIIPAITVPALAIITNWDQIMAHAKVAGAVIGVVAGTLNNQPCGSPPSAPPIC